MDLQDISATNLMLSIVFGTAGLAYFIYGKKQSKATPLIVGILLMVVPYFISNTLANGIIGSLLLIAPFIAKRLGL